MEIRIEDVDVGYGNVTVLKDIDLTIDTYGLVCIVGPNGVGKSTLVKCIDKLLSPQSGHVYIDGHDLEDIPTKELAKVMGFVPVTSSDAFSMSVMDTVLIGRHPHQKIGTTSDLDLLIVERTLNMMGIKNLAMRNFNELSAGQHQKVAIARGLAQTPKILVLDEPTSNLDVRHQIQVTELLHDLAVKHRMTIIMISHDLNITSKFADQVIMMAPPGTVYKVGTPSEVFTPEAIRYIYGVDCKVIDDEGRPHIILGRPIPEDELEMLRNGTTSS
ncbi:MAG: ABC transporter ATP-binding protein [archaeon]|nr:ABC transporter ATP-binding protein [archaeon]